MDPILQPQVSPSLVIVTVAVSWGPLAAARVQIQVERGASRGCADGWEIWWLRSKGCAYVHACLPIHYGRQARRGINDPSDDGSRALLSPMPLDLP
jgi:hypothetical protein